MLRREFIVFSGMRLLQCSADFFVPQADNIVQYCAR
jgi:hypothetical protein